MSISRAQVWFATFSLLLVLAGCGKQRNEKARQDTVMRAFEPVRQKNLEKLKSLKPGEKIAPEPPPPSTP